MDVESGPKYEDSIAWLSLKLLPDVGNRSLLRLIRHFGSPASALNASGKALSEVAGLRAGAARALIEKRYVRAPLDEWRILQERGIRLLCLGDSDYPANLAAIPDPPAVLFVQGEIEPRDLVSIAVVGSRSASPMGMAFTERLCGELAHSGVTVVSGLAIGIDSAAHRGSIKAHGRTLAVLGCGLDIDYPRSNSDLRKQIAGSGALLTEFPLQTPPAAGHFPMRNRIISGLTLGVVVVEAAHRSGSLITARFALEQGREVFAVPGLASHYRSTGPHRLLRQGAKLVESAEDILEEIRPVIRPSWAPRAKPAPEGDRLPVSDRPVLDPDESTLMESIDQVPRHVDELCRAVQWPAARVAAVLLALELKGAVRQLPGKYFVRAI